MNIKKSRKDNKRTKGFTLIELLVVVVIIGILAAIATPIYLNQRKAAWRATAVSDATNGALAIETARVQNGGTLDGVHFTDGVDGRPLLITTGGTTTAPASASVPTPTAAAPDALTTSGWATGDGGVGWQATVGSSRFLVSGIPATIVDTPDPQLDLADSTPSIRFATSDQLSRGEMTTMAAEDFKSSIASGRITIRFMPDGEGVQAAIADAKSDDLTLQIVFTARPHTTPQAGAAFTNRVEATGSAPANSSYEVPNLPASGDSIKSPVSPGNTEQAWTGKDASGAECYAVMTTNKNVPSWAAVRTSAGLTTGTPPANGSAECPKPAA